MDNEEVKNEEVIEQEVETTEAENDESTVTEKETKKFEETPEAKYARLTRQREVLAKKLGLTEEVKPSKKSDDFGYDIKAFLTANGVKGTKEFEFVKTEMKKSGQDLESLLENDYFQHRLKTFRELNKTSEATIKGTRSGGVPTDSVDYWASKPMEEVPQEMRIKVVNHKLKQNESKGGFYNS